MRPLQQLQNKELIISKFISFSSKFVVQIILEYEINVKKCNLILSSNFVVNGIFHILINITNYTLQNLFIHEEPIELSIWQIIWVFQASRESFLHTRPIWLSSYVYLNRENTMAGSANVEYSKSYLEHQPSMIFCNTCTFCSVGRHI